MMARPMVAELFVMSMLHVTLVCLFSTRRNGGLSSARNFALPYTDDCPLVTFVDSDDWLEPGIYQSAVSYLQQHPEVSILGYGHNKVQDTCSSPCLMPEMTLSREEALDSYLTANKLAIEATVWSRIYRRQAIEGAYLP